jgi:hypothetical protein
VTIRVHTDPQSAFWSLVMQFENVVIDIGGVQDYVPIVDVKITRMKEIYRSIRLTLKWNLPSLLVQDLVAFAISHMNMHRTMTINLNVAPRVLFTGLKRGFEKELSLCLGTIVKFMMGWIMHQEADWFCV